MSLCLLFRSPSRVPSFYGVFQGWDGAAWGKVPMYRWNGAAWEFVTLKVWTGTEWGLVDTTGV